MEKGNNIIAEWVFFDSKINTHGLNAFLIDQVDNTLKPEVNVRHLVITKTFEGKDYIIKRFSPSDNQKWGRKIDLTLKSYIISGGEKSYRGSRWLWEAEIPSIKPVAWVKKGLGYHQVSYFVYEKIDALGEVKDFLEDEKTNSSTKEQLIRSMADITRTVHAAGFRHTDIVSHNFLVQNMSEDGLRVLLIDTDKIEKVSVLGKKIPIIKLFFDLRCLRRLRFSPEEFEVFFGQYFNGKISVSDLKMWYFWVCGGFNIFKRYKMKKRLPDHVRELNFKSIVEGINSDDK